jgi:PKD repeat protein
MQKPQRYFALTALVALTLLGLTGCRSTPVEVLGVSGPDSLQVNQSGTFSATINEKAKPPVQFRWDFGDGATGSGNPVTHAYTEPGTYTVTVTASNRKGKSTSTRSTSVVVYRPPVPAQIISITADPMQPDTRTAVRFSANVRGDQPITYQWNFGDGSTATGANPTHTYSQAGTYTVTLNVSNNAGSDSRTLSITVKPYEAEFCAEVTELSPAFFDRNSSVLNNAAREALQENLEILRSCPNMYVRIEGWAAPGERNPQQLSADRARAVEQFYVSNGIAASRLVAVGRGRATGVTSKKEGAAQYRRADSIPTTQSGLMGSN